MLSETKGLLPIKEITGDIRRSVLMFNRINYSGPEQLSIIHHFLYPNRLYKIQCQVINFDEFVIRRIHQVFGVMCLVFGTKLVLLYRHVRILNTKHHIQNTLVNSLLF